MVFMAFVRRVVAGRGTCCSRCNGAVTFLLLIVATMACTAVRAFPASPCISILNGRHSGAGLHVAGMAFDRAGVAVGFICVVALGDDVVDPPESSHFIDLIFQLVFTTLAVAFALLHLILFMFSREAKANLYFALFLLFFAGNIFFDYQAFLVETIESNLLSLRIQRAMMVLNMVFLLLFIYSLNETRIPGHFWFITAGLVVSGALAVLRPVDNLGYAQAVSVIAGVEIMRELWQAIRQRKEGAWIVAIGFLLLFLFSLYDVVLDFGLMEPVYGITNGYPVGFIGLTVCMSVYLARDFALTNKKVIEQEIQHRILEAENARQSKELEEARRLQLSMLPRDVPALPHLDIAVYMKTATEVGGDYYDFHVGQDGGLTIAVGDATGHGTRAGMMVTIAKSLFHQLSEKKDLCDIFEECTRTIKLLHLDRLYMAMLLVRISGHRMVAAVAGMPPIAIYRAGTKMVDQVVLKGMPLGAFSRFPYRQEEHHLDPGDAVVLMSDGLPELFNNEREMLEYSQLCDVLQRHGDSSPHDIVHHLIEAGEKWSRGTPQHDDVTLVVVKVTG